MALRAPCIAIAMLCYCSATFAQQPFSSDRPILHLYPEANRSVWLDLYVPKEPDDPERVSNALGTLVLKGSPEETADIYDGYSEEDGASWSTYWYPELNPRGLLIRGPLDLEPLRPVLVELGITELLVQVNLPATPTSEVTWQDSNLAMTLVEEGLSTTIPLDRPMPRLSITYGFTPPALVLWYWPVLLCFLLLFAYAWYLRYSALKRPHDEAGAACFFCTRRSINSIIVFWVVLTPVFDMTNSWLPFEYYWGEAWPVIPEYRLQLLLLLVLGTLAALTARMIIFPVYARFPDATWTRRDFVVQCLWACGFAGVVIVFSSLILRNLADDPARANL